MKTKVKKIGKLRYIPNAKILEGRQDGEVCALHDPIWDAKVKWTRETLDNLQEVGFTWEQATAIQDAIIGLCNITEQEVVSNIEDYLGDNCPVFANEDDDCQEPDECCNCSECSHAGICPDCNTSDKDDKKSDFERCVVFNPVNADGKVFLCNCNGDCKGCHCSNGDPSNRSNEDESDQSFFALSNLPVEDGGLVINTQEDMALFIKCATRSFREKEPFTIMALIVTDAKQNVAERKSVFHDFCSVEEAFAAIDRCEKQYNPLQMSLIVGAGLDKDGQYRKDMLIGFRPNFTEDTRALFVTPAPIARALRCED